MVCLEGKGDNWDKSYGEIKNDEELSHTLPFSVKLGVVSGIQDEQKTCIGV